MEKTVAERANEIGSLSDESAVFKAVTSLRWDTKIDEEDKFVLDSPTKKVHPNDLLSFHHDRLINSCEAFQWPAALEVLKDKECLTNIRKLIEEHCNSPVACGSINGSRRVRVGISKNGALSLDSYSIMFAPRPFVPRTLHPDTVWPLYMAPTCVVVVDNQWTLGSHLSMHKTNVRRSYDDARERVGISNKNPGCAEVLLKNFLNEIVEASCCTPYFLRDGEWVTPPLSSGCQAGVMRRIALEQKICVEKAIKVSDLRDRERIWLSNGANGFFEAIIDLPRRPASTPSPPDFDAKAQEPNQARSQDDSSGKSGEKEH